MKTIEAYDRDYIGNVPVGQHRDGRELALLFYGDGTVRILHECRLIGEDQLVCAPALQLTGGHRIEQLDPVTVSPSILCPDCDLHGFVRAGRWEAC